MNKLYLILIMLIALLQYRLWLGDDGLAALDLLEIRLLDLRDQATQRETRNAALEADVRDLKEGADAIEERARLELGMIREGEVFVQIIESSQAQDTPAKPVPQGGHP